MVVPKMPAVVEVALVLLNSDVGCGCPRALVPNAPGLAALVLKADTPLL